MEKETYIKQIREACILANPSILDLKFGCEILYIDVRVRYIGMIEDYYEILPTVNGNNMAHPSECVILGRPIHLSDVLLAIPDNYIEIRLSKPIVLLVNHDKKTNTQWNLHSDSLEDQSLETLAFISSLLTTK